MKKSLITIAAAALTLAACSEQNLAPEAAQAAFKAPVISATMQQLQAADGTKVNFKDASDNDFSIVWELGDQIKVFNKPGADNYVVYKVVSVTEGKAKFEVDHDELTVTNDDKAYYKIDPKDDLSVFDPDNKVYYAHFGTMRTSFFLAEDGTIHTGRTTTSKLDNGRITKDLHNCVAKATLGPDGSLEFKFQPTLCYFKITFPDNLEEGYTTPGKILVLGGSGAAKKASCLFDVKITDEGLEYSNISSGNSNAAYHHNNNGEKANFLKGATYYLPVRAGFTTAGMKISAVVAGENYITLNTDKHKITTVAGKVYDLGTCIPIPVAAE